MSDKTKHLYVGLPALGVTVSGDVKAPTITNTGTRRIISYVLAFDSLGPDGQWEPRQVVNTSAILHIRNGLTTEKVSIPPNESRVYPVPGLQSTGGSSAPIGRVRVDSVVFEDGEYAGPDTANLFDVLSKAHNSRRALYHAVAQARPNTAAALRSVIGNWRKSTGQVNPQAGALLDTNVDELEHMEQAGANVSEVAATWYSRMPLIYRKDKDTK